MSNPNLPISGFQYVIDTATINQSANTIINVQNRIEQSTRTLTQRTESYDRAIGANNRSMRLLTSELVNLTGAGGQATSIITGLLAAAGPLDVVLIAIAAGVVALQTEITKENTAFEDQTSQLARLATSYTSYAAARHDAAASKPLSNEGLTQLLNETANAIPALKAINDAYDKLFQGQPGSSDFIAKRLAEVTKGELALGQIQNDRIRIIGQEVIAQAAHGASLGQIFDSVVKLKIATGEITEEQVKNREAFTRLVPALIETARGYQLLGESARASALASKLATDLLAAQDQFNSQSAAAARQHNDRMADIDAQGAEARSRIARHGAQARANIERSYARQIEDINEALADARASAAENVAERIADAEANAQDRRIQIDQQLADRRVSIEENYQDRIRQINEDYGGSVLDATIRRDATALYRAKEAKARGLKDAEAQRQKELANAQKEHDKQAKELADALAKQKAEIQKDYERRIRDLEANADKQRTKADENRREQLADQKQSEKDQLTDQQDAERKAKKSEKDSYDERQAQIAQSFADRKTQLIKGLSEEKELSERYAKDIINSLKGILNPDEIAALIKEFDAQLKAKIEITVTPYKPAKEPPDYGPITYAYGGYTGGLGGVVHPHEWVIPNPATAGNERVNAVLGAYAASRERTVSPVISSARYGGSSAAAAGGGQVTLEVMLNGDMLDSRIVRQSANVTTQIVKRSRSR